MNRKITLLLFLIGLFFNQNLQAQSFLHAPVHEQQPEWQKVQGKADQAMVRKQWQTAVNLYNQALSFIDDPEVTPQVPTEIEIKRLLDSLTKAQLLATEFGNSTRGVLNCDTMMRRQVRGFRVTEHSLPVQFQFGKMAFSERGQQVAKQLVGCLKEREIPVIKLIGHTDATGNPQTNLALSKKRAKTLESYLKEKGVTSTILTDGKGEEAPIPLDNPDLYSPAEIDAMNRRVEIVTE
jgi:outer membrane protein OmpA-like peptidoglycan-associated protein